MDEDINGDGRFNINDLQWSYLEGDGDFRSDEVKALRDEADIIVTNPPFSLFREFMAWMMEAGKQFSVIGNMNAITYKEVFPLIRDNKLWYGPSISSGDREFMVPESYPIEAAGWRIDEKGKKYIPPTLPVALFEKEMFLTPEIRVREWGGHANGSSVVEVTDGPYIHVFAGDECYTLANMEQKRPTGSCVDAARTKEFVEHYSGEHYLVHTCHDASLKSEEV